MIHIMAQVMLIIIITVIQNKRIYFNRFSNNNLIRFIFKTNNVLDFNIQDDDMETNKYDYINLMA